MQIHVEYVKHIKAKFSICLQIGIQLTHLNEIQSVSVNEQPINKNTLTQFFAVKSRGQHVIGKNKSKNKEDIALEVALKKSLKESKRNHRVCLYIIS